MDKLIEYIKSTLAQGYTKEQIEKYLLSQGYDATTVKNSFNKLNQPKQQTNNDQLQTYIYTYLQQGYSAQQLYDHLVTQGYNKKVLNNAFQNIDKQYYQGNLPLEVIHKHDVSTGTIAKVGVAFMIVFFVAAGFFFFMQGNEPGLGKLLDVIVTEIDESVAPGDFIEFEVLTTNMGSPGRVDVYYNYILRNEYGVLIKKEKEMKALETTLSFVGKIKIPSDLQPGTYELEVLAVYDSQSAGAKTYFDVTGEAVEVPDEPITPNKPEPTPEVTEPTPEVTETPTTPTVVSDEELFNTAVDVDNKNEGISNCEKITHVYLRNSCLIELASLYVDETICEKVDAESKDICYMGLIVSGKQDVCNKVTDPTSISLCKQYDYMNIADQYNEGTLTYEETDEDYVPDDENIDDYDGIGAFI